MSLGKYMLMVMVPSIVFIVLANVGLYFFMEHVTWHHSETVSTLIGFGIAWGVVFGLLFTRPIRYLIDMWFDFVDRIIK